jgi:hypothetical protein
MGTEHIYKNINRDMTDEFNKLLIKINCPLSIDYMGDAVCTGLHSCEINLSNKNYVNSAMVNPNQEFYRILEHYFQEQGIELAYNNTKTTFWTKTKVIVQ